MLWFLLKQREDLIQRRYRSPPVRRVFIFKPDGRQGPLVLVAVGGGASLAAPPGATMPSSGGGEWCRSRTLHSNEPQVERAGRPIRANRGLPREKERKPVECVEAYDGSFTLNRMPEAALERMAVLFQGRGFWELSLPWTLPRILHVR